jgi:hypothetical protein
MDELQIILAIAVLYATYRWYSSSSSSSSSSTTSSGSRSSSNPAQRAQRFVSLSESIPNDAFTQVQAMFPQMSEREIRWEFVRTGRVRNLDAVVQDLLEGRQTIVRVLLLCIDFSLIVQAPDPDWLLGSRSSTSFYS